MNVHLKSAFFISQAAGRHFIAQGRGKIINIASMLSFQGGIRVPSYTASKSGIAGITRLLANEWASKGININAIAPGYMATDNTAALRADEDRNKSFLDRIPAGRWSVPPHRPVRRHRGRSSSSATPLPANTAPSGRRVKAGACNCSPSSIPRPGGCATMRSRGGARAVSSRKAG